MGFMIFFLCMKLGIKYINTTCCNLQSYGCVEHLHGILIPLFKRLGTKELHWPQQLKFALFVIRRTPNLSIEFSPFEVIYGRNVISLLDLAISNLCAFIARNVKALDWMLELQNRIAVVRDQMQLNALKSTKSRRVEANKKAVRREFKVGEMVD